MQETKFYPQCLKYKLEVGYEFSSNLLIVQTGKHGQPATWVNVFKTDIKWLLDEYQIFLVLVPNRNFS